jgi:hypothetical protein
MFEFNEQVEFLGAELVFKTINKLIIPPTRTTLQAIHLFVALQTPVD